MASTPTVMVRYPWPGVSGIGFIRHTNTILEWCEQAGVEAEALGIDEIVEPGHAIVGSAWKIADEKQRLMFTMKWCK